jgi:hypothetical protein
MERAAKPSTIICCQLPEGASTLTSMTSSSTFYYTSIQQLLAADPADKSPPWPT